MLEPFAAGWSLPRTLGLIDSFGFRSGYCTCAALPDSEMTASVAPVPLVSRPMARTSATAIRGFMKSPFFGAQEPAGAEAWEMARRFMRSSSSPVISSRPSRRRLATASRSPERSCGFRSIAPYTNIPSYSLLLMRRDDFERLYEEHAQPLYGFLAYRTGDSALAEDLLADTFERALRARRRFDPRRAGEKTWLYAIALNLLRDGVRRTRAEQ